MMSFKPLSLSVLISLLSAHAVFALESTEANHRATLKVATTENADNTVTVKANAGTASDTEENAKNPENSESSATTDVATSEDRLATLLKLLEQLKESNPELSRQLVEKVEQHQLQILQLQQEKELLSLQNELLQEKNRFALAQLTANKERVELENALQVAKQAQALAELNDKKARLELENAIREQQSKLSFADKEVEKAQLAAQNALQEEKNKVIELKIALETAQIAHETAKLEYEKVKQASIGDLTDKLVKREQRALWDSQTNKAPEYLQDPYVNGELIISDRRIMITGPILPGSSMYVTERLSYFNNKSAEYPIFLIIDNCAGGSVMEGMQIIKAMQASQAPVYVVVKSLAASMAAVIATTAKRSFAYPDAIIIHHQVWSGFLGNLTQQNEQAAMMQEWSRRVMEPVANKMGMNLETLIKEMYKHNSDGNWREFADKAVTLKWVDTVVENVRDTSYIKQPQEPEVVAPDVLLFSNHEKLDTNGKSYYQLPPLSVMDMYHLYNPDNYYRY
ncbi:protease subunit of ATP-dependent protease [Beggiatoa alba B18LD]|uniref:Protease subunit of ATP-dependent protease n=1 Tax=Beggiatoa alba B18LD TaxID=395493 RepID=I3CHJ0_9GAMM|nr:ATP-dependent Clp protease proteolytic subunit [Beggiatoa alba]EIJ43083.1 protease subunit of ATP-dependent protease [Beggiatoa alba B18LD]